MTAHPFQYWLFTTLRGIKATVPFMHSKWGWPAAQIGHFFGLTLLVGTIFLFDLRLLGMARGIPVAALHKLVRWGVAGYVLNVITGFMFLTASPDQYIYNSAFQLKVLFMALAGLNILVFYSLAYQKAQSAGPGGSVSLTAKIAGASSLFLWTSVIVCGRMIAFHRPAICRPHTVIAFVATCLTK